MGKGPRLRHGQIGGILVFISKVNLQYRLCLYEWRLMQITLILSYVLGAIVLLIFPLLWYFRGKEMIKMNSLKKELSEKLEAGEVDINLIDKFMKQYRTLKKYLFISAMLFLIVFGLFSSIFAVEHMTYDSHYVGVFDVNDPISEEKIGTGKFEIITDGPLTAQQPIEISWVNYYLSSNYRIEGMSINIVNEQGIGNIIIEIPSEEWNYTGPNNIVLNEWEYITYDNPPFEFYSEGIGYFEVIYIINGTYGQGNTSTSRQDVLSSDFIVSNPSVWNDYQNYQIQAAGLVFGICIVTIPIYIKTMLDIFDRLDKQDDVESIYDNFRNKHEYFKK